MEHARSSGPVSGSIELVGYVDRSTAAALLFRIASVQDVPVSPAALGQSIWLPRRAVHCFRDRARRTICSLPRPLFARKLDELDSPATHRSVRRAPHAAAPEPGWSESVGQ